ncbi:hypothetical protein LCGC14_1989680, partial [marine sediment metagenome]
TTSSIISSESFCLLILFLRAIATAFFAASCPTMYLLSSETICFGVRSVFSRKGYNKVWLYPKDEIVIPGRVKKLDIWVWGGNYYYNLEAHVRDHRGILHKLPLGSLHFIGWKNLSVSIPSSVPQEIRYIPMEKPLTFVRFEIWTEPTERVDDFIVYFDHLKVLTDVYMERFDGDMLADRSRDIWSSNSETEAASSD